MEQKRISLIDFYDEFGGIDGHIDIWNWLVNNEYVIAKEIKTETALFKQVESVLGKEKAFAQLTIASYAFTDSDYDSIDSGAELDSAFAWASTPQGHAYWSEIHTNAVNENE